MVESIKDRVDQWVEGYLKGFEEIQDKKDADECTSL